MWSQNPLVDGAETRSCSQIFADLAGAGAVGVDGEEHRQFESLCPRRPSAMRSSIRGLPSTRSRARFGALGTDDVVATALSSRRACEGTVVASSAVKEA